MSKSPLVYDGTAKQFHQQVEPSMKTDPATPIAELPRFFSPPHKSHIRHRPWKRIFWIAALIVFIGWVIFLIAWITLSPATERTKSIRGPKSDWEIINEAP